MKEAKVKGKIPLFLSKRKAKLLNFLIKEDKMIDEI